jgi:hypothetical protein
VAWAKASLPEMTWDGMGWDGMGWDGMGWDGEDIEDEGGEGSLGEGELACREDRDALGVHQQGVVPASK